MCKHNCMNLGITVIAKLDEFSFSWVAICYRHDLSIIYNSFLNKKKYPT